MLMRFFSSSCVLGGVKVEEGFFFFLLKVHFPVQRALLLYALNSMKERCCWKERGTRKVGDAWPACHVVCLGFRVARREVESLDGLLSHSDAVV